MKAECLVSTNSRFVTGELNNRYHSCNTFYPFILQLEDEGDVYEMVDEDQYASIVERRRNEDDFVVDDSKLHLSKRHVVL